MARPSEFPLTLLAAVAAGPSEDQIAFLIAVGSAGMLLLAISIVLFVALYQKRMISEQLKRQQLEADLQNKMMQAELESQENERRRLAADLHDSIGGMLSAIRVGLSTFTKTNPDPNIEQTKLMLDDTISSVRRISRDLMPSTLERFGLTQAIKEMCERFSSTTALPISFQEKNDIPELDKTKELMLFRITQELINNSIKHAQATRISVVVESSESIRIITEDDGVGFDPDEQQATGRKGLGLFSIRNRATLLGAVLEFDRDYQKGTRAIITLPLTS